MCLSFIGRWKDNVHFDIILAFLLSSSSDFCVTADCCYDLDWHQKLLISSYRPTLLKKVPRVQFTRDPCCWNGQHSSLLPVPSPQVMRKISWLHSEPGKEANPADTELEKEMLLSHYFSSLTGMSAVISSSDRTHDSSFKLKEGEFRLVTRKKFFTAGVLRHESRLSREAVCAPPGMWKARQVFWADWCCERWCRL